MMDLGASVCLPNGAPHCDRCPAAEFCRAHLENLTDRLPVRAPKKPRRVESRDVYLLFYENRVALRRREETGLLAGLWEYPNELAADLPSEWGLYPDKLERAAVGKHIFTHIEWHLTALRGELTSPDLPEGWVWASREELRHIYAVPNAFRFAEDAVERNLL